MARGKSQRRKKVQQKNRRREPPAVPPLQLPVVSPVPPEVLPEASTGPTGRWRTVGAWIVWAFSCLRKWFWVAVPLVGLYATLYPRMSAQPLEAFDHDDPVSVPVTVSNGNIYAFREVQYSCLQVEARSPGGDHVYWNRYEPNKGETKDVGAGDSATASCAYMGTAVGVPNLVTFDFMLRVTFRPGFLPSFVPYHSERMFRFVAVPDRSGHYHVMRQPTLPVPCIGLNCK
jgi:hypothetical protein